MVFYRFYIQNTALKEYDNFKVLGDHKTQNSDSMNNLNSDPLSIVTQSLIIWTSYSVFPAGLGLVKPYHSQNGLGGMVLYQVAMIIAI